MKSEEMQQNTATMEGKTMEGVCVPFSQQKVFGQSFGQDLTSLSFGSASKEQKQKLFFILSENQHMLEAVAYRFSEKIQWLLKLREHLYTINEQYKSLEQTEGTQSRYKPLETQFRYSLQLDQQLPSYFVKGRKFELSFRLIDQMGIFVENPNKLLLGCKLLKGLHELHSSPNERKLLRYSPESSLMRGRGKLIKAEINVVSSKLGSNYLSLEVRAEEENVKGEEEGSIRAAMVRPLLLTNLSIKSKNFKFEREQN